MEVFATSFRIESAAVNSRTKVICKGYVKINTEEKLFGIIFPLNYPFQPPKVGFLKDLKHNLMFLKEEGEHFDRFDHSLCLFPNDGGTQSWRPYYSAVDALKKLQYYEEHKAEEDSFKIYEHTSEELPFPGIPTDGIVFLDKLIEEILLKSKCTPIKLLKIPLDSIFFIQEPESDTPRKNQYYSYLKAPLEENQAFFIFSQENPAIFKENVYGCGNLCVYLEKYVLSTYNKSIILENINVVLLNSRHDCVLYQNLSKNQKPENSPYRIDCIRGRVIDIPSNIFTRAENFLKDTFNLLSAQTVLLVGLGSMGSKIALDLAKSGVKHFVLYDYERLEPENICRHIGSLEDLGMKKVEIVKNGLYAINPNVEVTLNAVNPVDGENVEKFQNHLEHSDLCIVSTGNYESEMFVNAIATRRHKPVIFVYCDENVDYGEIFYYNPPDGPCYECLQSNRVNDLTENPDYDQRFEKFNRPDESRPVPGKGYYRTPGVPGISIDVEFVSLLASKLAITILSKVDSKFQSFYDIFGGKSFFYWQNRSQNLVDFGLHSIPVKKVRNCASCSTEGRRFIPDAEGRSRLDRKIRMHRGVRLESNEEK